MVSSGEEKEAEWLLQAQFCKKMAERAATGELRKSWLNLADKWLSLLDAAISRTSNGEPLDEAAPANKDKPKS